MIFVWILAIIVLYVLLHIAGILFSALFYVFAAIAIVFIGVLAATVLLQDGIGNGDDIQQ